MLFTYILRPQKFFMSIGILKSMVKCGTYCQDVEISGPLFHCGYLEMADFSFLNIFSSKLEKFSAIKLCFQGSNIVYTGCIIKHVPKFKSF